MVQKYQFTLIYLTIPCPTSYIDHFQALDKMNGIYMMLQQSSGFALSFLFSVFKLMIRKLLLKKEECNLGNILKLCSKKFTSPTKYQMVPPQEVIQVQPGFQG